MNVFFYGLFMDKALLAEKGVHPISASNGYVDGFALKIAERATLLRSVGSRAYGVVMNIDSKEAEGLYAESSVVDYVPEPVVVELSDGRQVDAACYNLPADRISGANEDYARLLEDLARGLGFPDSYLDQIRKAAEIVPGTLPD